MKIIVDSSVVTLEPVDINKKGKVLEYNIVSEGEVVGFIERRESIDTWGIATCPDFSFSVGFLGRLVQVMMQYQSSV